LFDAGQVVAAGQAAIRVARLGEKDAVGAIPETRVGRDNTGSARLSLR
jgi:hypothetical protein